MRARKKNAKAKPHSLENVALRELGIELDKEHQNADWGDELSPDKQEYAAMDVRVLLPLAEVLESKVVEAGLKRVREIEHRSLRAVLWMANVGVPFDAAGWKAYLKQEVEAEANRLRGELNERAPAHPDGKGRNWNSPQQVKEAFALASVNLQDTAKETLAHCDHPLAATLLQYREVSKIASTYGPRLLERVHPDGRIYPSWRQIGAATGRMSCSSPNIQQTPKEGALRHYIRAPEGRVLIAADYAQAELRILAQASGEPALIEAFRAGKDPYKATAASMFGIVEEEVSDQQRSVAKGINLSIIYGKTARGLAEDLGTSVREARAHMNRYFEAHPKVRAYLEQTANEALTTGVGYTLTGRIRRFGDVSVLRGSKKRTVERKAKNFPMQGSCADGLKLALALLYERRAECAGAVPIIALHDEIVVECDETEAEKVEAWLEKAMKEGMMEVLNGPVTVGADVSEVPVEVEIKSGKTWAG
jgi:DNA polymerase-1